MSSAIKYDEDKTPYIQLGDLQVRLESQEPDAVVKEKARNELRETPEIVGPAIEELRALVKAETTLHIPTDDNFLIMCLRPTKFYPQSAMDKIQKFFKFKVKHSNLCDNIMPSNVRHVFEQELVRLLPKRDQNGVRILLIEFGKKWKPSKCSLDDLYHAVQVCALASMIEPTTQICGVMAVVNFDGLALSHVMQFKPSFVAMLLEWVQETLVLRLKAVHMVNHSYVFNMLFAMFKPSIQEKLRKRIFFHGKDMNSLTSHIEPDVLPVAYGGTLNVPDLNGGDLYQLFQLYKKEFELSNSYGYNSPSS